MLIAISLASFASYQAETRKRAFKADSIELSDIKYGMFNIDAWEEQFAEIVTKKIEALELSGATRKEARKKISAFLYEAIDKFERTYKAKNDRKAFLGISLKNIGAEIFEIFGELRTQVPTITEDILNFLEDEENRENIKNYVLEQINAYTEGTFQKLDYTHYNVILAKYNSENGQLCKAIIQNKIDAENQKIQVINWILFAGFIVLLLHMFMDRKRTNFKICMYITAAIHLLLLGIFLPMIAIDARIASMELQLMGEPISFTDQVLYYKSKSIMEVAKIMFSQHEFKVALVGVLVLLFSVIFPISKLLASVALVFKRKLQESAIIRFIVFKSGKWSMADVMIVAIFMAYIGFSGIISSQLGQLEHTVESLDILTTNNSELQSGFFFFMGFVILSIIISQSIQKMLKTEIS